jgi:hypothetical protein
MAVRIQLRRDTSTNWTSANPILAEGEVGVEINTGLFKVGNGSSTWTALAYSTLRSIDTATVVNFSTQAVPTPPAAGTLNLLARPLAGRMMLRQQGPSGLSTPLQPSFFQNNIMMINASATTSITSIGNTLTSASGQTISHPAATAAYGFMANMASASTAGSLAGTGFNGAHYIRGTNSNDACGFFYSARLAFPDSDYNGTTGATGSRIFVGLTNQTMANSVASDDPAGHFCGFFRRHVGSGAQDANWLFATKNNVTLNPVSTGLAFAPEKVYDFYIFCAPAGTEIFWRIDNITDQTSESGSTTAFLPDVSIYMRAGFQLQTVNAVARNIRMQRVYVEADR